LIRKIEVMLVGSKSAYLEAYTGANRYYYLCMNDALAFGGGGHFALHVDEDL
jgi:hypothetical protein